MSFRSENIEKLIPLILRLPLKQHFDIERCGDLSMQASGSEVSTLRSLFPGVLWKKHNEDTLGWWSYTATFEGIQLKIYADRVGPQSCKRIVETVEEVVYIPATEAHDEIVKREVIRWECPEDEVPDDNRQA